MWLVMLISLLVSVVFQVYKFGFNAATMIIIVPTVVSLIKVIFENSQKVRVFYRNAINKMNLSSFDIDFQSVFVITDTSNVKNINKDYLEIQTILYNILKNNGYDGGKNELVEPSMARVSGVKMYLRPHKMYMSFIQDEKYLTIRTSATLKFKNGNEIIERLLIEFYRELTNNLHMKENKYIMKVSKNTQKENFMEKHFIKELTPKQIKGFEISVDHKSRFNLKVNNKEIVLVTKERADLVNAIKYSVELIN